MTAEGVRSVAARLADVAAAEGCRDLFTLMGAGNLWFVHHLATDHGVAIHHLRHENGAVGAADGQARATGGIGWCTVTQGPGFTNAITALLTASRGRSPVLLLVSDSSNLDPQRFPFAGGVQALRPESLLDPLGIASVRADGTDAPRQLREVVHRIRAERQTIAFIMPAGLDRLDGVAEPVHGTDEAAPAPVRTASAFEFHESAQLVASARSPLIVAGLGAVDADAGAAVVGLAERLGAPVATSVPASGVAGSHPLVIGQLGGFSIAETERIAEESDVIIAIGASLNAFQTRSGAFIAGRAVVRFENSPGGPAPYGDPARVITHTGDIVSGIASLRDALDAVDAPVRTAASVPRPAVDDDRSRPGAIDPRVLSLALDGLLPAPRRIVVDNGHFGAFPMIHLVHHAPRSLVWLPDFGAVGSALAAAYASATVDPDVQSVLFIGDCGLYMTLGDLETPVRERTPLIVVCMNDGAAGSELVHMGDWGVPGDQAIFGYADLAALARGMGAQGAAIRTLEDIAPALRDWDRSGPLVLDCHVSRDVRSPIYDHA